MQVLIQMEQYNPSIDAAGFFTVNLQLFPVVCKELIEEKKLDLILYFTYFLTNFIIHF